MTINDHVEILEASIRVRDKRITELEAQLASKDARIAGLEDKIRYLVSEKRNRTFIDEGWNAALEEAAVLCDERAKSLAGHNAGVWERAAFEIRAMKREAE